MAKVKVLFVCMGNICRSPVAEGVFAQLIEQQGLTEYVHVDSAGTHAYHVGNPPDPRSLQTALRRGLDISNLRARRFSEDDFHEFDYVLAMDSDNYRNLSAACPPEARYKLKMFLEFAPHLNELDVPDPWREAGLNSQSIELTRKNP